jgi:type IV pilus assembly protein PilC
MPRFLYQALNTEQQSVAGEVHADSAAQAVVQLEASGLAVQSIGLENATGSPRVGTAAASPFAGPGPTVLQRHLHLVLERSRDIAPALRAYADEVPSARRRRELHLVVQMLERGESLEVATQAGTLPGYWIPLLTAASSAKDPARVLREFLKESRRVDDFQRQWWLALAYPMLVIALSAAVLVGFSFFIIPIFTNIFQGFGIRLPRLTVAVLTIAEFITSGKIILAALVLAAVIAVAWWGLSLLPVGFRNWFTDRWSNPFGRATTIARFSQFTADCLESNLDASQALRLAGMATDNSRMRRAGWSLANDLETNTYSISPRQSQLLTATFIYAVRADMSPASRVRLLRELADCHAQRAGMRLSWTRGIIEPLAICAIGVLVGGIVLALFMPLITLLHGLS